jgi:peptidoglycan/LPS O-acetylase OafA/YrhL
MSTVLGSLPSAANSPGSRAGSVRLPVINGLRGLAIIGVLSCHFIAGMFTQDGLPPALSVLLASGWSGVNLFFILSGFVLFLPYAADDGAAAKLDRPFDFYRRRGRRLLPLFYIGVIGSWGLAVIHGMPAAPGQLLSVLSLDFIVDSHSFGPTFNWSLWSLGDEIGFSLMFPLLVVAFRRLGVVRLAGLAAVFALAMRVIGIWRSPALQGPTFNSDMFLCRIDEFVFGMMLAHAYVAGRFPRRPLLLAGIGAVLILAAWTGFDLVLRQALPPICRAFLNDVLDAGLVAVVVAALVPHTRLAAALSWRPLQFIGVMCYSLYIWHLPLLNALAPDRAAMSAPALAGAIAAFLCLSLVVAALSYRFIEFPRTHDWRRLFLLSPTEPRAIPP